MVHQDFLELLDSQVWNEARESTHTLKALNQKKQRTPIAHEGTTLGCSEQLRKQLLESVVWGGETQGERQRVRLLTKPPKSSLSEVVFLSPHYLHLGFQALKELGASLEFQASLALMEVKESPEVRG